MNRRFLVVAIFAAWAHCSASFAQITVEPKFQPGAKMSATLAGTPLEGATAAYAWTYDEGVSVEEVDGGRRLLLWAAPSNAPYGLHCDIVYTLEIPQAEGDPKKWVLPPYHYDASFMVEGAGPPPVKPPLAVLAGDKAKALGTFYATFAPQIGDVKSVAAFKIAHSTLLKSSGLADNGAAAEIERRLTVVLVDPLDHTKLKSVLEEFVAELGSLPPPVVVDPSTATAAVYIYEKDDTPPPSSVRAAINRVNRETKVRATEFEDDATDGDGDVPDQYKVPLKAARDSGLPAFVVTAGDAVVKVVPRPTTEQQILEAVQ